MKNFFLLLILAAIVSGCGKKMIPPAHKDLIVSQAPLLRQFRAEIEGVECAICAQDAVDIIKNLDGVTCADFVCVNNDYEQGYVRFYYDASSKNIDLRLLDATLQKIGFELSSLRGAFYIELFSADGKKFAAFNDDIAMPFCYSNNIDLLKKMISSRPDKIFADGNIKKDPQEGSYFFTLLGQA